MTKSEFRAALDDARSRGDIWTMAALARYALTARTEGK
jgi:hypothetical protein